MSDTSTKLIYTDPRTIDGDPFEVAAAAVAQAERVGGLLSTAVADAAVLARNAELERRLQATGEATGPDWTTTAQGVRFTSLLEDIQAARRVLVSLGRAASYNPRRPPKETE